MHHLRNLLVFVAAAGLLILGYVWMRSRHSPGPAQTEDKQKTKVVKKDDPKRPAPIEPGDLKAPPPEPALRLGDASEESRFFLAVTLDRRGGGVRSVTLNRFKRADEMGRPADGPLELVPAGDNAFETAFALYHFDPDDPNGDMPLDTLGKRRWDVVEQPGGPVVRDQVEGRNRQRVAFRTEAHGVVITKTFSLFEGEYHVGLQVDLERPARKPGAKDPPARPQLNFRYQLTGAKGLPIEGRWYTGTFRNAMIGLEEKGSLARDLQESRQVSLWGGGNAVDRGEGLIRYAGVAVQYFASMIVVDENQDNQFILRRARPTLETAVAHGKIKAGSMGQTDRLVLTDGKRDTTIHLPPHLQMIANAGGWREGETVAVVYRPLSYDESLKECPLLATNVYLGSQAEAMHGAWYDDVTVRVSTAPETLKPGQKATHRYLLYHGPVKPSLLGGLGGPSEVDPELVKRYSKGLHLNTMTDYHSPGWFGTFASTIRWTWLVIQTTNLMHLVLNWLHWAIPSYGIGIILLTVMVRMILFPLSRKQAIMSLKMQELAPEVKKLKDIHKDDHAALTQAQMALFKKHGVNPLGSCWIILLQMPIFMGLYFALQESITFRLAPFWPTWIDNLAAPDMMINWGKGIPWISRDQDFGGFLYLGPYLNLLPIVAVALMIVQQKLMTPPAADEQQEMQQKMMMYMMIFFGLMFYKVAAGLCVYFIASSLWGFAERKLLPKAKLAGVGGPDVSVPAGAGPGSTAITGQPNGEPRKGKRKKKGGGGPVMKKEEEPTTWFGRLRKNFRDRLNEVLEEAKKKKPGERGQS
jgi:YidC/Oxa1 family membrane protein insertase